MVRRFRGDHQHNAEQHEQPKADQDAVLMAHDGLEIAHGHHRYR